MYCPLGSAEQICGTKRRRLQMGCLSSENLKEREEVLVSSVMVAQRAGGYWSTLLTLAEGEVAGLSSQETPNCSP
jgi:hypothetical protein